MTNAWVMFEIRAFGKRVPGTPLFHSYSHALACAESLRVDKRDVEPRTARVRYERTSHPWFTTA